jgi:hypothetical protein
MLSTYGQGKGRGRSRILYGVDVSSVLNRARRDFRALFSRRSRSRDPIERRVAERRSGRDRRVATASQRRWAADRRWSIERRGSDDRRLGSDRRVQNSSR